VGDIDTTYSSLWPAHGHPEPFRIDRTEIRNEDPFSSSLITGCSEPPLNRGWGLLPQFSFLYKGLKQVYPNITMILTAYNEIADYNIPISGDILATNQTAVVPVPVVLPSIVTSDNVGPFVLPIHSAAVCPLVILIYYFKSSDPTTKLHYLEGVIV